MIVKIKSSVYLENVVKNVKIIENNKDILLGEIRGL